MDQLQKSSKHILHLQDSTKSHNFARFKYTTTATPAKTTPAAKMPERRDTNPALWVVVVVVLDGDVV